MSRVCRVADDTDGWSLLSLDSSSCCEDGNIGYPVILYPFNECLRFANISLDDLRVLASDKAIRTTVNKSSTAEFLVMASSFRDHVGNHMCIDRSADL